MKEVIIYTDGGSKPNPGVGGWASILLYRDTKDNLHEKVIRGFNPFTTNNVMEMTSIIEGLKLLKTDDVRVLVYSDSQYCVKGIMEWRSGWKRNGWRSSTGELKNKELWIELDSLCDKYNVTAKWVKGHNGNEYNERVDKMCTEEIAKGESATK